MARLPNFSLRLFENVEQETSFDVTYFTSMTARVYLLSCLSSIIGLKFAVSRTHLARNHLDRAFDLTMQNPV